MSHRPDIRGFLRARRLFAAHVVALLARPGHPGPVLDVDRNTVASLDAWDDEDLAVLLDEGRRQADAQASQLEAIRTRAQTAQAITLALLTVYASQAGQVLARKHHLPVRVAFFIGAAAAIYGLFGLLAVTMTQVRMSVIHAARVSHLPRPLKKSLPAEYAEAAIENSSVLATSLTVFREGVVWVTLSTLIEAAVWIGLKVAA